MNSQGRLSREEGAAIPARISLSIFSFSTGRSLYLRTLLRLSIVSKVWFSGSCRWFPVEEQAMRKTVIKKKRQILIKTGLYGL